MTLRGYAVHLVGAETSSANDATGNWCMADSLLTGSTQDHGTPYARGITCYTPPPPDSDTEPPIDSDSDSDTEPPPVDTFPADSDTDDDCTKTVA